MTQAQNEFQNCLDAATLANQSTVMKYFKCTHKVAARSGEGVILTRWSLSMFWAWNNTSMVSPAKLTSWPWETTSSFNQSNDFTSSVIAPPCISSPHINTESYLLLQLLFVPRHNLSFGSRAFRVSAPKVWNTLPLHIRQSQSLSTFRRHLKTNYFQLAYPAT